MGYAMSRALAVFILAVALAGTNFPQSTVAAAAVPPFEVTFGITLSPASVVVKVGEKVNVNVTLTNMGDMEPVCFSLEGFPETGFRTSFEPGCTIPQANGIVSVLTVEATPAAAPQSFTAFVIAKVGSQTAQTPISVTVEPAMPAWIPWLGLVLFFLILGVAVMWRPKLRRRSRGHMKE